MKIVFMGTPDFAVPCGESLWKAGHEIVAVFTQPDRPFGRKQVLKAPPVKEWALEKGIPVRQPEKIRETEYIEMLKRLAPEVIVVVAYGQILPKSILDIPPYGCINVHASLLPKYRGAAPINWSIIDGEKETGVTTMFMAEGLDTGDMIQKSVLVIDPDETAGMLHDRLSVLGAELIVETVEQLRLGTAVREAQDDSVSCYASMLDKKLSQIDWTKSARQIHDLVRGMNPWPVAWTEYDGKKLKIFKTSVEIVDGEPGRTPGTVGNVEKNSFTVICGIGRIRIEELQMEGGKRMTADVFLRGNEMKAGDAFGR